MGIRQLGRTFSSLSLQALTSSSSTTSAASSSSSKDSYCCSFTSIDRIIDGPALERFLRNIIGQYCCSNSSHLDYFDAYGQRDDDNGAQQQQQQEILAMAFQASQGLARKIETHGSQACIDELSIIIDILASFVSCCASQQNHSTSSSQRRCRQRSRQGQQQQQQQRLPACVIYQVHFFTGQINEALRNYSGACRAYLQAMWIATSCDELRYGLTLPITLHRVGKLYGTMGRYQQAKHLLHQAIVRYARLHQRRKHLNSHHHLVHHGYITDAKKAIQKFDAKYFSSSSSNPFGSCASFRSDGKLALIAEVDEEYDDDDMPSTTATSSPSSSSSCIPYL